MSMEQACFSAGRLALSVKRNCDEEVVFKLQDNEDNSASGVQRCSRQSLPRLTSINALGSHTG